ncbi:VCBS repeat-containing protein [bacterium]|nr:VCBS repeat-containing protein [bacterium]
MKPEISACQVKAQNSFSKSALRRVIIRSILLTFSLALCCAATSSAQWVRHELPVSAAGAVHGSLEIHDWDGDGDDDLTALYTDSNFLANYLPATWEVYSDVGLSDSLTLFYTDTADVDNDGDLDYAFSGRSYPYVNHPYAVGWIERLGELEFTYHLIVSDIENSGSISTGDLDNDGDVDFLTVFGPNPDMFGFVHLWYQQPDGTFEIEIVTSIVGNRPSDLADFNGDGWLDFLMATDDGLEAHFGSADGWTSVEVDPLPGGFAFVFAYYDIDDFDGDGDLDFVTQRYAFTTLWFGEIAWWENEGGMAFSRHTILYPIDHEEMNASRPLRMLDIDNDGDMDVAVGGIFFINQGDDETFVQQQFEPDDPYHFEILEKADIDNDGDVDLFNEHVYWYENPTNDPPQFIIRLVPRQMTVPSAGGEVVFDGMIYNQFPQPMEGHVWADVTGPNGNSARVWHRRMTVTNGEWLTWPNLGLAVPGNLIDGEYRLTVRAGAAGYGFVPGDSLRFVKEGEAQ